MKKLLYLTGIKRQMYYMQRIADGQRVECIRLTNTEEFDETWKARLIASDVVILTQMGTGLDNKFLRQLASWLFQHHPCYALLITDTHKEQLSKGFTENELIQLKRYIATSGIENYKSLVDFCLSLVGEIDALGNPLQIMPPKEMPWYGIMGRNGEIYETYDAFAEIYGRGPGIGVFFYREEWISNELDYQKALFYEIEKTGATPIIFFGQYMGSTEIGSPSFQQILKALFGEGQLPIEVLINVGKFSLLVMQAIELDMLQKYNIPVIQGYCMYTDFNTWHKSEQGLTAMEVSLAVSHPEMDGAIHGGVVASMEKNESGKFVFKPVEERIQAIVCRAYKWWQLRVKENKDKKIAIILHNYPAKNSNIGSAAGLDSPESVWRLLKLLKSEGYVIADTYENSEMMMKAITANMTNDKRYFTDEAIQRAEGKLITTAYREFFDELPENAQQHLVESWGEPAGDVFVDKTNIILPGFANGNVWIAVQPARGFNEDPAAIYHNPILAPTHQYEAFYEWLRTSWQADAVLHIGTHGNLEWLPGKATGLSPACYPEMSIQELPNIYPYWTTIVGEGIQAKRRGAACLIGHMSPPTSLSGIYEEYEELEQYLDEYSDFKSQGEIDLTKIVTLIREKAETCHFAEEFSDFATMTDEELVNKLHDKITDLKYMQMRSGLHILGQPLEGENLKSMLKAIVRVPQGNVDSLPEVLAKLENCNFEILQTHGGNYAANGERNAHILNRIWSTIDGLIDLLAIHDYKCAEDWLNNVVLAQYIKTDSPLLVDKENTKLEAIKVVLQTICNSYVPLLQQTEAELIQIIKALEGHYIEPGPGGAVTSGKIDVLPTGRNFYGVDERTLPTRAAYMYGCELANQVIEQYIAEEGKYPESVGIILWAGSNTRSHGACAAQFLNLLGVRPIWQRNGDRVIGLEAIPLSELKRPRIDITGRISGLIRDMMPNVIKWLDKAVILVSELEESEDVNFVKKHINEDVNWLIKEGEPPEEAYIKARWRIFGDPPQAYGAGISKVLEGKNWETIDDLAEVYMTWSSYAYSTAKRLAPDKRLFRRRASTMEVTIKNEDNRETNMLSSDDYNSYHGGLIATVRSVSGKTPKSYVGDSSDRGHIKVRTLDAEMKRVFRAEPMNPKFIEGMMQHGYKGALEMANYVAHTFQWDATSSIVEDWMYEGYANKYALDKTVQDWMRATNPWALQRLTETLLEAQKRGLWNASTEMISALQDIYLSVEGTLESDD